MNSAMATETGSRERFEEESVTYLDALYRNALVLTKSREDAEDLVQDTYLKALRYYDTYQEGTNLKAWLFKIQYNAFIQRSRRNTLERHFIAEVAGNPEANHTISENSAAALSDAEAVAMWPMIKDEVEEALQQLPDDYRLMMTLVCVDELKYNEIAEVTDCPIGTVMSRIHRARKLLRENLKRRPGRSAMSGFTETNPDPEYIPTLAKAG